MNQKLYKFLRFLKNESKEKYEFGLLLGTSITFIGLLLFYFLHIIGTTTFWTILIVGKVIVILSIMGYLRYKKFSEGIAHDPLYHDLKLVAKKVNLIKRR